MNVVRSKYRLLVLLAGLVVFLSLLMSRVFWLQMVQGGELTQEAEDRRIQEQKLMPVRGTIYDCNHNELVVTVQVNTVVADPTVVREVAEKTAKSNVGAGEDGKEINQALYTKEYEQELKRLAASLASLLEMDTDEVLEKLNQDTRYIVIKRNVDMDTTQKLMDLNIGGVLVEQDTKRAYRQANLAAHVLGFVGLDQQGLGGIEKSFDQELQGIPGKMLTEVDADGRRLPQTEYSYIPPAQGENVVLTLDQSIQFFVEKELDKIMAQHKPAKAMILVADPKTGAILAMGNRPTFDPEHWNDYAQDIWDKNPAIWYSYEPGSTFKVVSGVAALEENIVTPEENFYCPGYHIVTGTRVFCSNHAGHGAETFAQGVMNSCNPVYIQVGLRTGKELLYKYINAFGFGQQTGIELPGEEVGRVNPVEKVIPLDLATISIGQSISVTPIQMLRAICTVANDGKLVNPHIVKCIEDEKGNMVKNYEKPSTRQVISPGTARQMGSMMQKVILEGGGKKAFIEGYSVAGKTGTAEVPGPNGRYVEGKYVSSFAGFAPVDDPRIAVLVVICEPSNGQYYGSEVAAPVFHNIGKEILRYLQIPEDPSLPVPKGYKKENTDTNTENTEPQKLIVPNVVGFTLDDALQVLENAGFAPQPQGENGIVQSQNPGGYSTLKRGGTVQITAVQPTEATPEQIMVPDLKGLAVKKAGTALENLGLRFNPVGSGIAVSQNPKAGEMVSSNDMITVEFAQSND